MIYPERKLAFIHIPKTGGSSVAAGIFKNYGINFSNYEGLDKIVADQFCATFELKHARFSEYPKAIQNNYIPFAIIRNPIDRFYSQYGWYTKFNGGCTLDQFCDKIEKKEIRQWHSQKYYAKEVNTLFRFEDLEKVMDCLEIPKYHKKNGSIYRKETNYKINERVMEIYKDDFDYFGFTDHEKATKHVIEME